MPQITTPNFAMDPQSLAQIANVRVADMPHVWDWRARAEQADQASLADMMRAAGEEQQLSPIRVKRANADLQSVLTSTDRTRGLIDIDKQDLRQKTMDNDLAEKLFPKKIEAEWAALVTKLKDEELKQGEIQIIDMIQNGTPEQQALGRKMYPTLKAALAKKFETDEQLRVTKVTEAGADRRQAALFAQQKDLETMRTGRDIAKATINAEARNAAQKAGADPKKWQELAVQLQVRLRAETDPEIQRALATEIEFAQTMAERLAPVPKQQLTPEATGGMFKDARGAVPTNPLLGGNPNLGPEGRARREAEAKKFDTPNEAHIAKLKASPELAEAFDAKFGPGAAAKILGK